MPQVVWSNDLQLPAEATSARLARAFVAHHLLEHDLGYLVDDIQLVVSELVTNAVVHAKTPVRVSVEEQPPWLRLTVYDDCANVRIGCLDVRIDDDAEGGRGLWLTNACSADWGTDVQRDGKSVWATFAL